VADGLERRAGADRRLRVSCRIVLTHQRVLLQVSGSESSVIFWEVTSQGIHCVAGYASRALPWRWPLDEVLWTKCHRCSLDIKRFSISNGSVVPLGVFVAAGRLLLDYI
jgi:hypothetical protein